jgi:histidinol-phosphatase
VTGAGPDLELALALADEADAATMAGFSSTGIEAERKADGTPVTAIDRAVERRLRERLQTARPEDAVLGEEHGVNGDAARRWILDPIDGTKNYTRGIPVFATLIALEDRGAITLGVVSAPALGRRWWGVRGHGAFADGRPLSVSRVDRLEEAVVTFSDPASWRSRGRLDALLALTAAAWHVRAFGDFWGHMLVAEGVADVAAEIGPQHWDLAAAQVIVEEAGGRFTGLDGVAASDRRSGLSTNGLLHDRALAIVGGD